MNIGGQSLPHFIDSSLCLGVHRQPRGNGWRSCHRLMVISAYLGVVRLCLCLHGSKRVLGGVDALHCEITVLTCL